MKSMYPPPPCPNVFMIPPMSWTSSDVKSIPNGHMLSWTYGRVNARVHEKVFVLFQESFNATTIFLQLCHFLLDVFQEVHVGPIKSKLPYMASTFCFDLLSQLNSPIPQQVKTTWYFNQQVSKPS